MKVKSRVFALLLGVAGGCKSNEATHAHGSETQDSGMQCEEDCGPSDGSTLAPDVGATADSAAGAGGEGRSGDSAIPDSGSTGNDADNGDDAAGPIRCAMPDSCVSSACELIDGKTFVATMERECGISPEGVVSCYWSIAFSGGSFQWQHSDVGESGNYTCEGWTITGTSIGSTLSGSYDRETEILTWQGDEYKARP